MVETLTGLLHGSRTVQFDRGVPVDAQRFRDEVARVAGGLASLGIGPGDRVAVWLPNVPAWLSVFFGAARLGAVVVSVNTRLKSRDLAAILRRSRPRALIFWPGFIGIDFRGILAACEPQAMASLSCIVAYGEAATPGCSGDHVPGVTHIDFATLCAASPAEDSSRPSAPCILFSTSGTTREPKLVLHDQVTLIRHAGDVAKAWHLGEDSAVYLVPPMCGVFGLCTALAAWAAGVPLWMRPEWDAGAAATEIVRGACTHVTGTDDAFAQLLAQRAEPVPFPSLVYAGYAPFNPALANIVADADVRGLRLSGLYGASEVQALFATQVDKCAVADRAMAGGRPVDPEARVRARDTVTGELVPDGQTGELEILAPRSRMVGYFGDDAATAAAFTDDGWYRTGDLGYATADGGFVFLSRAGDSLRLGGFLVSPVEIESVIQEAGGIEACQVVAVARPEGTRAVAFVIPCAGRPIDEAGLTGHVRARLASYKVPVRFFAIDEFPVTVSANATKIRRDVLRDRALELLNGNERDDGRAAGASRS